VAPALLLAFVRFMSSVSSVSFVALSIAAALAANGALVRGNAAVAAAAAATNGPAFRVCADPNNLPYSNSRGEGFENRIAEILARDLGQPLTYAWRPQRRGFIRNTLNARQCDVVIGVPAGFPLARTTRPYYRSTYVFVTRHDRRPPITSFDDPQLRRLTIGIQITGEDYNNPPPAVALASRQLVDRIRGFTVYGNYADAAPQRAIIDAVADRRVDVAIAWGPLAGYFAAQEPVRLDVSPVSQELAAPGVPFAFDIAIGVRRDDVKLATTIDAALVRQHAAIQRVLAHYRVPIVRAAPPGS
jgi:mxaJ protein